MSCLCGDSQCPSCGLMQGTLEPERRSTITRQSGKRIFVPLAEAPWARFLRGHKTVEVRNAKSPVAAQVRKAEPGAPVLLRLGYGRVPGVGFMDLVGELGRVWQGRMPMPGWAVEGAALDGIQPAQSGFFDPAGELLAFEVLDVCAVVPQQATAALLAGARAGQAIIATRAFRKATP